MTDDDDGSPIEKALNLIPMGQQQNALGPILAKVHDDSAKEDFTYARANIREVIEVSTDAIAKLAMIADQSQQPRDFEVLARLMDTTINASKRLLEIQKEIRSIEQADKLVSDDGKQHITNNNLFVGSTSELASMIAKLTGKTTGKTD